MEGCHIRIRWQLTNAILYLKNLNYTKLNIFPVNNFILFSTLSFELFKSICIGKKYKKKLYIIILVLL